MEPVADNFRWVESKIRNSEDSALRNLAQAPLPGSAILAQLLTPHLDEKTEIRYLRSGKSGAGVLLLLPDKGIAKVVKFGESEIILREFHNFETAIKNSLLWSLTEFQQDAAPVRVGEAWASFCYRWVGGRYNVQQIIDLLGRRDIRTLDITEPLEELIASAFAWYKDHGLAATIRPPSSSWVWSEETQKALLSILQKRGAYTQELCNFISDPFTSILHKTGNARFSLSSHTHGDVNFRNVAFFGNKPRRLNSALIDFERMTEEACPARDWAKLERDLRFKCVFALWPTANRYVEIMNSVDACLRSGTLSPLNEILLSPEERKQVLKIIGTVSSIRQAYIAESSHFSDLPLTEYLWLNLYWWMALLFDNTLEIDDGMQDVLIESARSLLSQLNDSIHDDTSRQFPCALLALINSADDGNSAIPASPIHGISGSLLSEFLADTRIAAQLTAPFGNRAVYLDDVYVNRVDIEMAAVNFAKDFVASGPTDEGKWLSIIGDAGHGKTSILWYLARELSHDYNRIFPVQALHLGVDSLKDLIDKLPIDSFPFIFLLDTLDLLIGIDDARLGAHLNAIRSKGGLLVTTCRRQEIQTLAAFTQSNRTLELQRYKPDEAHAAVERYVVVSYPGSPVIEKRAQARNVWELLDARRRIQNLTFEPLLLRMIFEAYVPDKIPPDINTQRVYDHYWAHKVLGDRTSRNLEMASARSSLAKLLASHLYFGSDAQSERVPLETMAQLYWADGYQNPHSIIESLVSTGVLRFWQIKASLGFFHQTFAEYTAAKAILERADDDLRRRWIETLIADVELANLFRLPVLKQLMIQASGQDARMFEELSSAVANVNSPVAVRLALEVLGKAKEYAVLHKIVLDWCKRSPELIREVATEVLRYYPAERVELALKILDTIAFDSICGEIFSDCRLFFAPMKPQETLAFLRSLWAKNSNMCHQYGDLLKDAIIETFNAGEVNALATLGEIFPKLSAGVQSAALDDLANAWSAKSKKESAVFIERMLGLVASGKKNEVRVALARTFAAFSRIDGDAARRLAVDFAVRYRDSSSLKVKMFSARLLGITAVDAEEIDNSIRDVLDGDHESRLCGSEFLREAGREHPEILDKFLAMQPTTTLRREVVNAIYFVASGVRDPAMMLAVLDLWPPTGSGSGDAYRDLIAGVSDVDPAAILTWVKARKSGTENVTSKRLTLVGFQILAEHAASKLSSEDFREFFLWGYNNPNATDEERRVFASSVGFAADVDLAFAKSIVRRIFATHRKDFINATLNSLRTVSSKEFICFVLEQIREFILWKTNYDSLGYFLQVVAWRDLEIRGRILALLTEPEFLKLIKGIDSPEVVSNLFKLLKSTAKFDLHAVLLIIDRCPLLNSANSATLAVVLEIASRQTDDPSILRQIFRRLLELSANPSDRLRNALLRAFPRIDVLLPHREVVSAVIETLISAKNWEQNAIDQLARSARKLPSLTRADRETLVRADLPPRTIALLMD